MRNWQVCEPMIKLAESRLSFTIVETKNADHANYMANKLDILEFDGVLSVSGDGFSIRYAVFRI